MTNLTPKQRGKMIRNHILKDVKEYPNDLVSHISKSYSISRQAVNRHLKKLIEYNWLEATGTTRNKVYRLGSRRKNFVFFDLQHNPSKHTLFFEEFGWVLEGLPKNVSDIIYYGFTEMVNNAIDHSEGIECYVSIKREIDKVSIIIFDNGEGIFKRINRLKNLIDEKQALLELSKRKLTTDPDKHSGQGIFFTSRMFDTFCIISHKLIFTHDCNSTINCLTEHDHPNEEGTLVMMSLSTTSDRTDKEIFKEFK